MINNTLGSYLINHFSSRLNRLARTRNDFQVTLCWLPGHADIHGNEEADKQAKRAAEGCHNSSPLELLPGYLRHGTLPLSVSVLKEAHCKTTQACWESAWCKSPRFNRINHIDPKILQHSFIKLMESFPKRLTSLYIALCSHHIPLCKHLHRIGKEVTPHCPHCPGTEETVPHFLLDCPHYCHERHVLTQTLGCNASSMSFLLSDPSATLHLVHYINATGRLRTALGEVPLPHKPPD
ncbi:hypothetical protein BDR04DRAFT_1201169 [Suillus decipiens]|nr:hypothetical protein BDR04DRAFT_1201169 [Suillus decipiens]